MSSSIVTIASAHLNWYFFVSESTLWQVIWVLMWQGLQSPITDKLIVLSHGQEQNTVLNYASDEKKRLLFTSIYIGMHEGLING